MTHYDKIFTKEFKEKIENSLKNKNFLDLIHDLKYFCGSKPDNTEMASIHEKLSSYENMYKDAIQKNLKPILITTETEIKKIAHILFKHIDENIAYWAGKEDGLQNPHNIQEKSRTEDVPKFRRKSKVKPPPLLLFLGSIVMGYLLVYNIFLVKNESLNCDANLQKKQIDSFLQDKKQKLAYYKNTNLNTEPKLLTAIMDYELNLNAMARTVQNNDSICSQMNLIQQYQNILKTLENEKLSKKL